VWVRPNAGEREFGHSGLCDDHRARTAEAGHDRGIGERGGSVGEDPGTRARGLTGDIEQVLDADDGAVERAERLPARPALVGGIGLSSRGLRVDRKAGARAFARRIGNTLEGLFQPVAGRPVPWQLGGLGCQVR
jgi:hypothetical protein